LKFDFNSSLISSFFVFQFIKELSLFSSHFIFYSLPLPLKKGSENSFPFFFILSTLQFTLQSTLQSTLKKAVSFGIKHQLRLEPKAKGANFAQTIYNISND